MQSTSGTNGASSGSNSADLRVSGAASGIDSGSIVQKLMAIDAKKITRLQNKKATFTNENTAWQGLNAQLLSFQTQSYFLTKPATFNVKTAMTSDDSVMKVSANDTATTAEYQIQVAQIASSHQLISKGYRDYDATPIGSGTITLEQGGGFLNPTTRLDELNGMTGIGRGVIRIVDKQGNATSIDLSNAISVNDVLDAINQNNHVNVSATINSGGNGLVIRDKSGGTSALAIYDLAGGSTAADLGLATGVSGISSTTVFGTPIKTVTSSADISVFNNGLGIRESNASGTDFTITRKDDAVMNINLANITDIAGFIAAIKSNGNNGDGAVTARLNPDGNGIILTDSSSGGAGRFTVTSRVSETNLSSGYTVGDSYISLGNVTNYKTGDRIQIKENDSIEFRTVSRIDTANNRIYWRGGAFSANYSTSATISNANSISDLGFEMSTLASTSSLIDGNQIVSGINTSLVKLLNGGSGIQSGQLTISDRRGISADVDLSYQQSTTLTAPAVTGATSLSLANASVFRVGDRLRLAENQTLELATIARISGNTVYLTGALTNGFSSGVTAYTRLDTPSQILNRLNSAPLNSGTGKSELTGAIDIGATTATVASASGFSVGDTVKFFENDTSESHIIQSISGNTLTFSTPFQTAFSSGNTIWVTPAIQASLNSAKNGFYISDLTNISTNNLIVTNKTGSTKNTAQHLGLDTTTTGVSQNYVDGTDQDVQWIGETTSLSQFNFGKGIYRGSIQFTNREGTSATIDLSDAATIKTVGDVIKKINALGMKIIASINTTGDGILVTDTTGSSSNNLIIAEVNGGKTASDLGIVANTSNSTKDGSLEHSLSIGSTDTLQDIANDINSLGMAITATVVNDGASVNPYKLMLTSNQSGTIGQIVFDAKLTGGRGLEMTSTAPPKDTALLIGSTGSGSTSKLIVKSDTHITDAIPGVTMDILKPTSSATTLSVTSDYSGLVTTIKNFVSSFNKTIGYIDTVGGYDAASKTSGPLFGSSTTQTISETINSILTSAVSGVTSTFSTLAQIGIKFDQTGQLSVDTGKLESTLRTNLTDVKNLFSFSQNMALSSSGATSLASSSDPLYLPGGAIDGNANGSDFESGSTGWKSLADTTSGNTYFEVGFSKNIQLAKVSVVMLGTPNHPAADYALSSYTLQYFNGSTWRDYASVIGNTQKSLTHTFDRPLYASKIRISNIGMAGKADNKARLVEVQAYQNQGIAARLSSILGIVVASDGVIANEEDAITKNIQAIDKKITQVTDTNTNKEQQLIQQFTAMETYISNMQNQSSWMAAQLGSSTKK